MGDTTSAAGPRERELLLQARGVSMNFGGVLALDDVDLSVYRGEIAGLIGPNGAGKTTLFNVISGVLQPTRGRVMLDGKDITSWQPHKRGRAGMARTFQRLELFDHLSVADNLLASWEAVTPGAVLGRHRTKGRAKVAEVMERLRLGALASRVAGTLPTGQARVVELARALCTGPRVLLLDEPSSGLDQAETVWFGEILKDIVGRDIGEPSILLVEHDMSLVMEICDEITVLDFGRKIACGTPVQVRNDPAVIAAYLGAPQEKDTTARFNSEPGVSGFSADGVAATVEVAR
ncbi:MAG: ABC transporter ATP-binding protein [Actinobacteria bacterium]|nr:ABC transporter ATP-binding protein [Actinomycetota bacterium]